ncbi:MAG TPA: type II toxin-antitoxin system RelE/ParE family toxin [Armatimonadota bacterium]|nr:type II toxin-antitoxin system RelE/ParE family toxin [Armatimonadota bacterium]
MCSDQKLRVRSYGPRRAELIQQRLDELRAAEALEDIRRIPGPRCHELKQNRQGQLSVDLDHPYRLLFEPANDPVPRTPDGGLDWSQVNAVRILEVINTHE